MNTDVAVTGLRLVTHKQEWSNGDRLLATFDCNVRGFSMRECLLIRASRGMLLAQAPKANDKRDGERLVRIIDKGLQKQLADAAYRFFQAVGGSELD